MKRRKFLEHMTVTPLVAAHLSSVLAAEPNTPKDASPSETVAKPIPPWAGREAQAWANAAKAIMISDMSQCQPASALSPRFKKGHWKVFPYELQGGISGKIILALRRPKPQFSSCR